MWRGEVKKTFTGKRMIDIVPIAPVEQKVNVSFLCLGKSYNFPKFIEIGVEILNPIQPKDAGMDPKGLEEGPLVTNLRSYGTIDEQETLLTENQKT